MDGGEQRESPCGLCLIVARIKAPTILAQFNYFYNAFEHCIKAHKQSSIWEWSHGATNGYKEHIGDLDRGFTRSWRRVELLISKFWWSIHIVSSCPVLFVVSGTHLSELFHHLDDSVVVRRWPPPEPNHQRLCKSFISRGIRWRLITVKFNFFIWSKQYQSIFTILTGHLNTLLFTLGIHRFVAAPHSIAEHSMRERLVITWESVVGLICIAQWVPQVRLNGRFGNVRILQHCILNHSHHLLNGVLLFADTEERSSIWSDLYFTVKFSVPSPFSWSLLSPPSCKIFSSTLKLLKLKREKFAHLWAIKPQSSFPGEP